MKTVTVSIYDDDDRKIVCKCNLYPGRPGRWYMPNGDPGYPDEPAECEIESATFNGRDIVVDLTEFQQEEIEVKAWEMADEDGA